MEGFAAAANAAGVLNLGLVVCQELLSYYGSWKGAAEDVKRMYASIEALAKTLLCLKRTYQKEQLDTDVVERVRDDAASASTQSLNEIKTEVSKISLDVKTINTKLSPVLAQVDRIGSVQEDQYRTAIYDWFSPLSRDFAMKQHETFYIPAKQDRLGHWMLKTAEYQEWLLGSGKALWCIGDRGVGKTVLASFIINNLQLGPNPSTVLSYLYCNYNEAGTQSAINLMKSILRQLASRTDVLNNDLERFYKEKSSPSFAECCQLLHKAADHMSNIHVVIDALDECTEATRDILLTELEKLRPKVCLIITSRHTFGDHYEPESALCLKIHAQEEDIKQYLSERVETSRPLRDHIKTRPELRDQVLDVVITKANGMFLLARLHMDSLMTMTTTRRLKSALNTLPEALDETYDQVLERIKSQHPDHATLALKTLGWIHHASRPLKTIELQHALAVEEDDSNFDADGILDLGLILTVCAGLVTVREGNAVGFVHYTTEEYLERHRGEHFPDAPIAIAKACLTYLSFDEFSSPLQFQDRRHWTCLDFCHA
ncbi:hypothetical protein N7G274_009914 [Stereocaulon virgatum]|uniref:NACHT domain-containing protein n=1 Tax=Stereocaulon virgatum TaxID=373712 RepID=A0ABR3ZY11_9LECA